MEKDPPCSSAAESFPDLALALYLRRFGNELTLTVEHRAAPSLPPIQLELAQQGESLALQLRTTAEAVCEVSVPSSVDDRILRALSHCDRPVPASQLRAQCGVRKATFYAQLEELTRSGRLLRSSEGYRLATIA